MVNMLKSMLALVSVYPVAQFCSGTAGFNQSDIYKSTMFRNSSYKLILFLCNRLPRIRCLVQTIKCAANIFL